MMQLGLLMDHRLTRQSSPPVASSRPEPLPSTSEDTLLAWATISSAQERARGGSQELDGPHGARAGLAPLGHQLWHQMPLSRALPSAPPWAPTPLVTPADEAGPGPEPETAISQLGHAHPTRGLMVFFLFLHVPW